MIRGFFIPGLTMAASEVIVPAGACVLENPEVGAGITLGREYDLREVAALHAETIARRGGDDLVVAGISMGGMLLSIIATEHRSQLPARCRFVFFATTPNLPEHPALPPGVVESWRRARPGDPASFAPVLEPFFGRAFLRANPDRFRAFCEARAHGHNRQSPAAFYRQTGALARCPAHAYFARLDGAECGFVGGGDDRVLGPAHNAALRTLVLGASHEELPTLGHMVHMERPDLIAACWP
jgi:pimeloyl-ACP methyl ester carboxylesterase